MARTRTTPTAKLSPKYGTSSGTSPGEDFESPEDLSDVAGIDAEIPRGNARPSRGLLQPKPKARSPLGLEAGKSAGGGLGIVLSVPLGGPISGRGGINLGEGGSIEGGSLGLGLGLGPLSASIDAGVDQDEQGRGGCYQYVTVSLGPFSHTYGRNVCEPKQPAPASAPISTPSGDGSFKLGEVPPFDPKCRYCVSILCLGAGDEFIDCVGYQWSESGHGFVFKEKRPVPGVWAGFGRRYKPRWWIDQYAYEIDKIPPPIGYVEIANLGYSATVASGNLIKGAGPRLGDDAPVIGSNVIVHGLGMYSDYWTSYYNMTAAQATQFCATFMNQWPMIGYPEYRIKIDKKCPGDTDWLPVVPQLISPLPLSPPPLSPPVPNPPPKKKMDDKCCKAIIQLLLMQHKHLGVSPTLGVEPLPLEEFAGVKAKGEVFQEEKMSFPFEVPKRWIDPVNSKRTDRITVRNLSELLFVIGAQSERLERVMGTGEFLKDSQEQLRQSEIGTLKWLTQRVTGLAGNDFTYPDPNDFWFNTDDGIINEKKVEVKSMADGLRYLIESQNRLERILPVAEIKNSTIPARWVYPGKKGQLRVGNLIHLVEYMFRADDRARGFWPQTVKIKDANPAIKGDQKIELKFESQADMLREILKFLIDTEGDGDISNNFALRSAIQNCQQHQLLVQNNAMLDAIVEYMDFKIERTKTKVPMPFSPFAGHQPNLFDQLLTKLGFGNKQIPGSIDKNTEEAVEALFEGVLQNTEVEVPIIKANEKKSMSEAFMEILKHASAASAAVSERVGEGALKRLVDSAGISQAVSRFLFKRDIAESNGVGDLDQWINSAEAGYTDKLESSSLRFPESNPLEPYDRPIAENPQIREIDTKDPKAD